MAWGTYNNHTFNKLTSLRISQTNGQLTSAPGPADVIAASAEAETGSTTSDPTPPASAPSTDSDTSTSSSSSSEVTVNVTLTGQFLYNDHATQPVLTNSGGINIPDGLNPTPTVRPIRKARVQLEHRVEESAVGWTPHEEFVYTDDNGGFTLTVPVTIDPSAYTTKVRASVCTVGPEQGNLIRIEQPSANYYCLKSAEFEARININLGPTTAHDSRAESAPWNIYDVALESFEFLTSTIGKPTEELVITWQEDYNWVIPSGVSAYLGGMVRLDGSVANGDQWNDAVIAHEIGHWVMDKYSDFPNGYLGTHYDCIHGNMAMQYSEAWANFFMAASRTQSRDVVNRTYAPYYIDAKDDNEVIGSDGRMIGPKVAAIPFDVIHQIEVPDTVDSTRPADEQFRRGNFCEWSITGALWDILDSSSTPGSSNEFPNDDVSRSFADIFTAFSSQVPSTTGAKYPQNINHWWYNWTNTLNSRPGAASLGDENKVLSIFKHHEISVGYQIQLTWTEPNLDLDAHLWFPDTTQSHIYYEQRGNELTSPFATLYNDVQTTGSVETINITKPVLGTYRYGVFNWTHRRDNPQEHSIHQTGTYVKIFDESYPEYVEVKAVDSIVATSGLGHWWSVFNLHPLGEPNSINELQATAPTTYAATEGNGAGKSCIDAYEPDDTAATAAAYNPANVQHTFCMLNDKDWITFTVATDTTNYRFETSNLYGGADTVIELYASDGTTLIEAADEGGSVYGASLIQRSLNAGTYYLRVRDYYNRGGVNMQYDLNVTQDPSPYEPNGTAALAPLFPVGSTQSHSFWVPGDTDWVKLVVPVDTTNYRIETSNLAGGADTNIQLFASDATTKIDENEDSNGSNASLVARSLDAGTYYIQVRSYRDRGGVNQTYDLSITKDPSPFEPNGKPTLATNIPFGTTQSQSIWVPGDKDWVKFTARAGANYRIETFNVAPGNDTVTEVYAADGTTRIGYAEGSVTTPGIIGVAPEAGTVYVRVKNWYNGRGGANLTYDLRITEDQTDSYEPDGTRAVGTALVNGSSLSHRLGVEGDQDWVTFSVAQQASYTMETINGGNNLDTVLELWSGDGLTRIDSADEGGASYGASRLVRVLDPGSYFIKVRHYYSNQRSSTASYDLLVYANP